MKMLGWVHRKFRQSWVDSGREFPSAGSSSYCLAGWPSPDGRRHPNLPPEMARAHEVITPPQEKEPAVSVHIVHFDGLLTIGTFGSPIIPEPVAASSDEETTAAAAKEIAEKETEVTTESELKTIMVELERVLAAESEKEKAVAGDRKTSSSVSQRPSLAGKRSDAFPLQDFLFGSPDEVTATPAAADRCRKRRVSLGELFLKSRSTEEAAAGCGKWDEPNPVAEIGESAKTGGGGGGGGGGGAGKSRGAKTKFQSIMRIFHTKIHPENLISASKNKLNRKAAKEEKNREKQSHNMKNSSKSSKSREKAEEGHHQSFSSIKRRSFHKQQPTNLEKNNAKTNGEQWIKTDAHFLVLEL